MEDYMFLVVNGDYLNAHSTVLNNEVSYSSYLDNNGNGDLTVEKYCELKGFDTYEVLTWEEFRPKQDQAMRSKYLNGVSVITEEQFYEMLNCLPPLNWYQRFGLETFMMSEFLFGDITAQYGSKEGKFICKNVVHGDPSTHIKLEDFEVCNG